MDVLEGFMEGVGGFMEVLEGFMEGVGGVHGDCLVSWRVLEVFTEGVWLQEKLKQVFDNLIQLDHANLVKFHKYWTDTKGDKRRVS